MGTLYIISTPIGNLNDISIRAITSLFSVDMIACEDCRTTHILLDELMKRFMSILRSLSITPKKPKLISFYDEIEKTRSLELVSILSKGSDVALISESGTPLISDPGFNLVRLCRKKNIPITHIPGPTALTSALVTSGLPTDKFFFLGFLPSISSKRLKLLNALSELFSSSSHLHPTIIAYESPYRIHETIRDIFNVFGDIRVAVARELTKIHEEILYEKASILLNNRNKYKGELVVLFNPRDNT